MRMSCTMPNAARARGDCCEKTARTGLRARHMACVTPRVPEYSSGTRVVWLQNASYVEHCPKDHSQSSCQGHWLLGSTLAIMQSTLSVGHPTDNEGFQYTAKMLPCVMQLCSGTWQGVTACSLTLRDVVDRLRACIVVVVDQGQIPTLSEQVSQATTGARLRTLTTRT
jgi:hypothetical protein